VTESAGTRFFDVTNGSGNQKRTWIVLEATEKVLLTEKVQSLKIFDEAVPFFCIINSST
jgi:hypothetical protein